MCPHSTCVKRLETHGDDAVAMPQPNLLLASGLHWIQRVQESLLGCLKRMLRKRLEEIGWPPSLAAATLADQGAVPAVSAEDWHGLEEASTEVNFLKPWLTSAILIQLKKTRRRACSPLSASCLFSPILLPVSCSS